MSAKTFFQILAAALCFAMFLWMVQSCKTPKVATEEKAISKSEITTDNNTEIEKKDSTITIPADSAITNLLLQCDSMGQVLIKDLAEQQGKNVELETRLQQTQQGSLLAIKAKQDSMQVIIESLRARIREYNKVQRVDTFIDKQVITETVEVVPEYYKKCARGFWITIVAYIFIIGVTVYRKWSSIKGWFLKFLIK